MALSAKLSTSIIRPFGFSFGRQNSLLLSSNFHFASSTTHQHSSLHYQSCNAPLADCRFQVYVPRCSHHMFESRRSVSDNAKQYQPSSVINNASDPVLLAKSAEKKNDSPQEDYTRPTEEQLLLIANKMGAHLPQFFKIPHDFRMYHKNIIFEDNIRNVRTVGLNQYAWQIALVKMGAHFKFGKVTMSVLKITTHHEDGTVRIRWRVETFPGNSIVLAFWKFKLWNAKESIENSKEGWIDGFSILEIGGDGLIHKHICDKVIPNTDKVEEKKGLNMAMKLGIALGLIPGEHGFADNLLSKISEILSNL